jgi:hypothetical protein
MLAQCHWGLVLQENLSGEHQEINGFGVHLTKFVGHGFDIVPLIDGYGVHCLMTADLEAQEPSDFTYISNIEELTDFGLEPLDRVWRTACNSHVIHSNYDSSLSC